MVSPVCQTGPATFQKTLDRTLDNIPIKFNFLDDLLIITTRTLAQHRSDMDLIIERLDKENLAIKIEKFEFAHSNIKWLSYNTNQTEKNPDST